MYIPNAREVAGGATLSAVPVREHECLVPAWSWELRDHVQALKVKEYDSLGGLVNYRQRCKIGNQYAIQIAPTRKRICVRQLVNVRCVRVQDVTVADLEAMHWPIEASIFDDPCDVWDACQDALQDFQRQFTDHIWMLEWAVLTCDQCADSDEDFCYPAHQWYGMTLCDTCYIEERDQAARDRADGVTTIRFNE